MENAKYGIKVNINLYLGWFVVTWDDLLWNVIW